MGTKVWDVRIWEGKDLNGEVRKIVRSFTYITYKVFSYDEVKRQLSNRFGKDRVITLEAK